MYDYRTLKPLKLTVEEEEEKRENNQGDEQNCNTIYV
jgi:hypothetical protein